jgi:hypothetical protein
MQREFLVALQLEVAHHLIERSAAGRTRRLEPPATFGATKTPKTLLLNPYQLPAHREQSYRRQFLIVCRASYIHGGLFVREHGRFWTHLKQRNRLNVGSGFVRPEAISIAQYQERTQLSVDRSSRGAHQALREGLPCFAQHGGPSSFPHLRGFSILILVC